jgi:hypothetical protein
LTEQIIIIALLVLSIHYTMQPDEIFGKLGDWLEDHLPDAVHPAAFSCNICMAPHYGTLLYWLTPWHHELWQWPVVVIGAMGANVVVNKWAPEKKEAENKNDMIPENVLNAYEKVKGISVLQSKYSLPKEWQELFKYYNENNTRHLGMGCIPCFTKVFLFIKSKIELVESK